MTPGDEDQSELPVPAAQSEGGEGIDSLTPSHLADPGRCDLLLKLALPSHPLLLGLDVFLLPVLDREPRDVLVLLLEGGKELKDVCGEGRPTAG